MDERLIQARIVWGCSPFHPIPELLTHFPISPQNKKLSKSVTGIPGYPRYRNKIMFFVILWKNVIRGIIENGTYVKIQSATTGPDSAAIVCLADNICRIA